MFLFQPPLPPPQAPSGLDRELRPSTGGVFRFLVRATEVTSGDAATTEVSVFVGDVDDNGPVFSAETYFGVIQENAPVCLFVERRAASLDL